MEELQAQMRKFEREELTDNYGGETQNVLRSVTRLQEIIKDKQETLKRLFELVKDLRSHLEKVQDANRDDREPHYDKELVIDHAEEYARLEEEVEEIERLIENYEDDTESEDNIVENLANEEGEMDELREELGWMKSRIETTMDDMDEYMDDHKYTHLY